MRRGFVLLHWRRNGIFRWRQGKKLLRGWPNATVTSRHLNPGVAVYRLERVVRNADLSYKFAFLLWRLVTDWSRVVFAFERAFFRKENEHGRCVDSTRRVRKRYGVATEIIASMVLCCSFLCLLAGNLVGMAKILSYLFQLDITDGVFLSGIIILIYTACGGLFSVAYTDVIQSAVGMTGCLAAVYWIITNAEEKAPPPSIGFPDYVYPNEAIAKMYDGVPCKNVADSWCYNAAKWDGVKSDAGAPYGDKVI